jgi:ABC-type glycerol-3-phosphate transport system substrate-binding protein
MKRIRLHAVTLAVAALVLAGCGGDDTPETAGPATPAASDSEEPGTEADTEADAGDEPSKKSADRDCDDRDDQNDDRDDC